MKLFKDLTGFFILMFTGLLFLTSCDSHSAPTDNISFGKAWSYAWTLPAYYIWVIIAVVGGALAGYFLKKDYEKKGGWNGLHTVIMIVIVVAFFAALLAAPAGIAANTTVEQASRGVYIR